MLLDKARKVLDEAVRLNGPSAWTHHGDVQLAELGGKREEAARSIEKARVEGLVKDLRDAVAQMSKPFDGNFHSAASFSSVPMKPPDWRFQ